MHKSESMIDETIFISDAGNRAANEHTPSQTIDGTHQVSELDKVVEVKHVEVMTPIGTRSEINRTVIVDPNTPGKKVIGEDQPMKVMPLSNHQADILKDSLDDDSIIAKAIAEQPLTATK